MVLALGAGQLDQLVLAEHRAAQHRLGHHEGIPGETVHQLGRRGVAGGQARGKLGADRLLHLVGQVAHHVVEQADLGGVEPRVGLGQEQVGDLAQQFAPAVAGGLAGEGDQVVELAVGHGRYWSKSGEVGSSADEVAVARTTWPDEVVTWRATGGGGWARSAEAPKNCGDIWIGSAFSP